MKTLKNVAIFLAGFMTFGIMYSMGAEQQASHPREGTVVLENDDMRVIRLSTEKNENMNLAVVVYKN